MRSILNKLGGPIRVLAATVALVVILVVFGSLWRFWEGLSVGRTPEPIKPSPVDYSVDKNRLDCILRRIPDDVLKACTDAFPDRGIRK